MKTAKLRELLGVELVHTMIYSHTGQPGLAQTPSYNLGGFCWSSLTAHMPLLTKIVHMDYNEDARVLPYLSIISNVKSYIKYRTKVK